MGSLTAALTNTQFYVIAALGFIIFIMLFLIITMKMDISDMQRRYKKMMAGSEGENIEAMLTRNTDEVAKFAEEQQKTNDDIKRIEDLLERAITRVAVVRFNAFEDTSSELSYCVALLDDNKNGVIISAINGREESRSYAKPIENGMSSQYKLTKEEEQALREASGSFADLKGGKKRFGR